jgi:hypothetical protein
MEAADSGGATSTSSNPESRALATLVEQAELTRRVRLQVGQRKPDQSNGLIHAGCAPELDGHGADRLCVVDSI